MQLVCLLFFLLTCFCFTPHSVFANNESNFTAEVKAEFVNNYYWRGAYFYPEGVPAFQPAVTMGFRDPAISLNIWSSIPFRKRAELKDLRDELCLTLNYDIVDSDKLKLSTGFVSYLIFMGNFWNSQELYLTSQFNLWKGLGLYTDLYFDLDAYKGLYLSFGPSYSHAITGSLDFESRLVFSFTRYRGQALQFIESGFLISFTQKLAESLSLIYGALWNNNFELSKRQYALNLALAYEW